MHPLQDSILYMLEAKVVRIVWSSGKMPFLNQRHVLSVTSKGGRALIMKQLFVVGVAAIFLFTWLSYTSLDSLSDSSNKNVHRSAAYHSLMERPQVAELPPSPHPSSTPGCEKKRNIFFLKTHKCASSTVQNILMRFSEQQGLNLVLPYESNYLGHPEPFVRKMALPVREGSTYNVFCHHMRFNQSEVEAVMPPDTVYVSIVRDPVDLFESLFSYFDLGQRWNVDLASLPLPHVRDFPRSYGKFGRDQMLFDFGLDPRKFDDVSAVQQLIDRIERRFDLIMLAERFDESLILLKNLLCWQSEDVLYFRQNARMDEMRRPLNSTVRALLRRWNAGDQRLYDHFASIFDKRVKDFGVDKMTEELAELRRWNNAWYSHCVERKAASSELAPKYRSWSAKVFGFHLRENVHSRLCEDLAKSEIAFTTELRRIHIQRHGPSLWQLFLSFFLG